MIAPPTAWAMWRLQWFDAMYYLSLSSPVFETCQWCCSRMPVRRRRGAERRFCATPCRRAYDQASRRLGQSVAEADFPAPGELRSWSGKARALHEEAKSDGEVSDTPIDAPARPARPEVAPYNFVQFGHLWFVVDQDGQHVGGPLKTAVQAQRLARRMTGSAAKSP